MLPNIGPSNHVRVFVVIIITNISPHNLGEGVGKLWRTNNINDEDGSSRSLKNNFSNNHFFQAQLQLAISLETELS